MIKTLGRVTGEAHRLGLPVLAILYPRQHTALGENNYEEEQRTDPNLYGRRIQHCVRIGVELGADMIKTQYTGKQETFEKAVEVSCGVPILVAGGKKRNWEAVTRDVEGAITAGGSGISFGRNIFDQEDPEARVRATLTTDSRLGKVAGVNNGWESVNTWELVLPPSRPSRKHLEWFRQCLRRRSQDEPIGILGATPELRDLAAEEGFRHVVVFERSEKMFTMMTKLRVHDSPELWIKQDWLNGIQEYKNEFGLLLSDLTSGNVEYKHRARFYRAIAEALTNKGDFVDKVLTHVRPLPEVEKKLMEYEESPLNLDTINRFNCDVFFYSSLITKYGCVDSSAFYEDLSRRRLSKRVTRLLSELPKITPPGMRWDYGKTWHEILTYYEDALQLTGEVGEEPGSPYAGGLRLTTWKRK